MPVLVMIAIIYAGLVSRGYSYWDEEVYKGLDVKPVIFRDNKVHDPKTIIMVHKKSLSGIECSYREYVKAHGASHYKCTVGTPHTDFNVREIYEYIKGPEKLIKETDQAMYYEKRAGVLTCQRESLKNPPKPQPDPRHGKAFIPPRMNCELNFQFGEKF